MTLIYSLVYFFIIPVSSLDVIKYVVSWSFGAKYRLIHVRNNITIDKYTFSKSIFDEIKYIEEKKNADSNGKRIDDHHYGNISWESSIEEEAKIESESENELNVIFKIMTLQTNMIFESGSVVYRKYNSVDNSWSPATISGRSTITRNSSPEELVSEVIRKSIDLKQKLDSLSFDQKEHLLRALDWYDRGNREGDKINSYANYWIGFESMSFIFGVGSPMKCPKCAYELEHDSISKRMQNLLNKLDMTDRWKNEVKILYGIRSALFHKSSIDFEESKRTQLKNLLKDCIISYLNKYSQIK